MDFYYDPFPSFLLERPCKNCKASKRKYQTPINNLHLFPSIFKQILLFVLT